jgi:hypothetical protein
MHSHHIALALAEARAADVRRAATHTTATAPRRRHRRHLRALALLGLAATAALAAVAPTGALAQPPRDLRALANTSSLAGTTSTTPQVVASRQDLQSPDARDAAEGRGTFNGPQVVVVKAAPQPRPALTRGFNWVDAGIGAGLSAALLLGAAGVASVRRRTTLPAH